MQLSCGRDFQGTLIEKILVEVQMHNLCHHISIRSAVESSTLSEEEVENAADAGLSCCADFEVLTLGRIFMIESVCLAISHKRKLLSVHCCHG